MARKTPSKTRREKKEMAGNIRKRIISAQKTLVDTAEEVSSSKEMAAAVSTVAVSIEALSEGQEKLFNELIEELSKIPDTLREKESKSEKILDKLLDAIVELEKQLEEANDPEQKEKLQQGIQNLRGQADKVYQDTSAGSSLKTMGDVVSQYLGVSPGERKEAGGGVKGFLKAFVGQDKESGIRGDTKKFFGIHPQRTVDEMLVAKRGSQDIAGTLDKAKIEKENERKAAIAERLRNVPEHLRVKSDEQGRFRTSKKGDRIPEYLPSGSLNPRFQPASGMMGKQLVDEGSGYTYEAGKGVQEKMVPGGAGVSVPASQRTVQITNPKSGQIDFITPGDARHPATAVGGTTNSSVSSRSSTVNNSAAFSSSVGNVPLPIDTQIGEDSGSDTDTDTFKDDVLAKMDDIIEQQEDIESATLEGKGILGGITSILSALGGNIIKGITGALGGLIRGGGTALRAAGGAASSAATALGTSVTAASGGAIAATVGGGLAAGLAIGDQFNTSVEEGGSGNLRDWWRNTRLGGLRGESIADKESREQSAARADQMAQERGFANFAEMQAANRAKAAGATGTTPAATPASSSQPSSSPRSAAPAAAPAQPSTAPVVGGFTGAQQESLRSSGFDVQERERTRSDLMSGLEDARRRARSGGNGALETTGTPASTPAPVINNIDNSSKVNAPPAAQPSSGASVSVRDTHNSYVRYQDRRMNRTF